MLNTKLFKVIVLTVFLVAGTSCVFQAKTKDATVVFTTTPGTKELPATPQISVATQTPTLNAGTLKTAPTPTRQKTITPTATSLSTMSGWCEIPDMEVSRMVVGFDANWDGDGEIYTIRGDGSNLERITENKVDDYSPVWSPDGKRIAFLRAIKANGEKVFPLFVMQSDGLDEIQLTPPGFSVFPKFAWSPDSQRIAFGGIQADGTVGIYVINLDGYSLTTLFVDDAYVYMGYPTWAPDGERIAFEASDDPKLILWQLFTAKSDGSNLQRIESKGLADELPQWHPKEDKLLFLSQSELKTVPFQIFTIKPDGTDRKQITDSEVDNWNAIWSPSGQMIAYIAITDQYGPHPKYALHVLNSDGTNDVTIYETIQLIHSLKWAPDNRHLAFISTELGSSDLYIIDICDGNIDPVVLNIEDVGLLWIP